MSSTTTTTETTATASPSPSPSPSSTPAARAQASSPPLSSPAPSDISSIVPGTIFPDDIPPTLIEGGLGQDSPSPPFGGSGGGGGSSNSTQIEVSATIQTVLITLGIVIGALFLVGVLATYYISHKNRAAEEKKKEKEKEDQLQSEDEADGQQQENILSSVIVHPEGSEQQETTQGTGPKGTTPFLPFDSSFSSNALVTENEKFLNGDTSEDDSLGSGVGRGGYSISSTHGLDAPFVHTMNPYPTPTSSLSGRKNPRNSIMEVAQAYAHSQSAFITSDGFTARNASGMMGMPAITMESAPLPSVVEPQSTHSIYGNLGPSASTSTPALSLGSARPISPPSSSVGSNAPSMILLDPFETNNSSTASLNLLVPVDDTTADADQSSFHSVAPANSSSSGKDWSQVQEYLRQRKSEDSMNPRVIRRPSQNNGSTPPSSHRHTIALLSGPLTLLHSNTASTASLASKSSGFPAEISYQPPLTPTSPVVGFNRGSRRTGALANVSGDEGSFRPAARNGAAVFEGTTKHPRNSRYVDGYDEGQDGSDYEHYRLRHSFERSRLLLDRSDRAIVSLPLPRMDRPLNDDDDNDKEILSAPLYLPSSGASSRIPYMVRPDTQEQELHPHQQLSHPDPAVVRRVPKHNKAGSTGGKNSYLDDYREQQRLKKQKRLSGIMDLEKQQGGPEEGIITAGRRRSSKIFQNAIRRASQLYAPSSFQLTKDTSEDASAAVSRVDF
ncbi:hypothetical protein BGZ83_009914 [Gryganskiella cystojenkinii]|nr:hypothetical protein BGZ83_009914 [Gryganskiella cystojenkinii]